jgi:hypothetical protein
VPTRSKRIDVSLVGEILARKEKTDVFPFIPDREAICERSLMASPSALETEFLIDIRAICIKRFMHQAFGHGFHESIVILRRSLADYSNDARHILITGQKLENREQESVEIGRTGEGCDLGRKAALASCCLKLLRHLSSTFIYSARTRFGKHLTAAVAKTALGCKGNFVVPFFGEGRSGLGPCPATQHRTSLTICALPSQLRRCRA